MENQKNINYRNLLEYFKVFFRCRWLFITPIFVCFVLGIVACFLLPPLYEASTTIMVEEEKIINPLIQNLAVSSTAAQRMENIKEIILSWNSLVELTKKLNLAKNVNNQLQLEEFIKSLKESIIVRMREPNLIQISYSGKEPRETQLATQTLTDILIRKNVESQNKETDVAINFIKEQLAIYKRKIKESEISQLEDQLKSLLIDSTEEHPLVKELRHKIAVAKKELESGEYEVTGAEQPLNDVTRQALKNELDKIIDNEIRDSSGSIAYAKETEGDHNAAIYKLLLMDKVGISRAEDINVNKDIYQMLLQRLETAKITQRLEASKQGTHYTILEAARLPLKPTKPNKLKIIFLGILLGSFAGTGLVFGKEFMDHSFLDIEDAKNNLEMPILGAISRLTTQEAIDKEKYRKKRLITIGLISSAVLIILSALISILRR